MIKYESDCVGCGQHCLYERCWHYSIPVHYCDSCGKLAEYKVDGDELCYECLEKQLDKLWSGMSVYEKAEQLDIEIEVLKN